jgi:hypothetical protein
VRDVLCDGYTHHRETTTRIAPLADRIFSTPNNALLVGEHFISDSLAFILTVTLFFWLDSDKFPQNSLVVHGG